MITVTSEYLINIIERHINDSTNDPENLLVKAAAEGTVQVPNEMIADFLLSIPYFDIGLKNFILGAAAETVMIVSQAWEIEFILRTKTWATSESWHSKTFSPREDLPISPSKPAYNFLKLPY